MRRKKKRNLIIFSLIGVLMFMAVGYAAFQTSLTIAGQSNISSTWKIRIISVSNGTATGNASNESAPTFTDLTANMSANLYNKGDAMEYDVVIKNESTFDSSLDDVITNTTSYNPAIRVTFSGYTKGQKLQKNTTVTVYVKIEYDANYDGYPPTESIEVSTTFEFNQDEGGGIVPVNKYKVTYDCTENGGYSCSNYDEYLPASSAIDLTYEGSKVGFTFVGWNTDKNATTGITTAQTMGTSDVTYYAIYKKVVEITYEKEEVISSIGANSDTCTFYNKSTSCNLTLPTITMSAYGYVIDGWYDGDTKVGNAGAMYAAAESKTLTAKPQILEPLMTTGANFQTLMSSYKSSIIEIEFVDHLNVPDGGKSY